MSTNETRCCAIKFCRSYKCVRISTRTRRPDQLRKWLIQNLNIIPDRNFHCYTKFVAFKSLTRRCEARTTLNTPVSTFWHVGFEYVPISTKIRVYVMIICEVSTSVPSMIVLNWTRPIADERDGSKRFDGCQLSLRTPKSTKFAFSHFIFGWTPAEQIVGNNDLRSRTCCIRIRQRFNAWFYFCQRCWNAMSPYRKKGNNVHQNVPGVAFKHSLHTRHNWL